ncbi:MAG: class I SAM-dependent methyltransferase [Planctomycetaceae bacterium]|nr:class I SAM-dependent methyltransferase [Planctomycetaceae bacterium]
MASNFAKQLVPPILLQLVRKCLRKDIETANGTLNKVGSEKGPDWYDESFEGTEHWREDYTCSRYYFLWSLIVDRLIRDGLDRVFDVGCGPGQFACLARDRGIKHYWGLDFSKKRIEYARSVCPEFQFILEDALKTDKFQSIEYQVVIMTEVLEHVEDDLGLLSLLRPGTRVVASVPDFPYESHVRHFKSVSEVSDRYGPLMSSLHVDELRSVRGDHRYFLFDGTTAA